MAKISAIVRISPLILHTRKSANFFADIANFQEILGEKTHLYRYQNNVEWLAYCYVWIENESMP